MAGERVIGERGKGRRTDEKARGGRQGRGDMAAVGGEKLERESKRRRHD